MSFKRFALFTCCLLLALGGAVTAQSKQYALGGNSGGELAIGQGLPLPAQVFPTSVTGAIFPPLLVPMAPGHRPVVSGTTAMASQQKLTIPSRVLSVAAAQRTVGLFAQNPVLYAVATNLGWAWPAAPRTLSTGARTGAQPQAWTAVGGAIQYSSRTANPAQKFGGPARFAIQYGTGGIVANSPVTIYAVAVPGPGNPPCTHPAIGGANPACVAALGGAWPLTLGAIGATANLFASTSPLGPPVPGIGIGKFGASPLGTVSFFAFTPNGNPGFTNMASSVGFPWTTGMLTISQPLASPPELFVLTGADNRTAGGVGTIQLVSGSLSLRTTSGPNANRGWVRLQLIDIPATPSMSPAGIAAAAGLMLLAVAYVVRRRLSA